MGITSHCFILSAFPSATHSGICPVVLGSSLNSVLCGWAPLYLLNVDVFRKRRKGKDREMDKDLLSIDFGPLILPTTCEESTLSPLHKRRNWAPESLGLLSGSQPVSGRAQTPSQRWFSEHCACAAEPSGSPHCSGITSPEKWNVAFEKAESVGARASEECCSPFWHIGLQPVPKHTPNGKWEALARKQQFQK